MLVRVPSVVISLCRMKELGTYTGVLEKSCVMGISE